MRTLALSLVLGSSLLAAGACAPDPSNGDDVQDPCTGDETRCSGNAYQVCTDNVFVTEETCEIACNSELGCVECDPEDGNACSGVTTVVECNDDGTIGDIVDVCDSGTVCSGGVCGTTCTADGVDLIYVVDSMDRLLSFDPRRLQTLDGPFTLIGVINCPHSPTGVPGWAGAVSPFSMAVDRDAKAWVLYASGEIFHVDPNDSAACTPTTFEPQQNDEWLVFGMGFVTDGVDTETEKLYLGGGSPQNAPGGRFGVVDPTTLVVTSIGNLLVQGQSSPEFTGTGAGELWGFYPGGTTAFIQQIDKTTGASIGPQLTIPGGFGGQVQAWAFAQWGGKFYMFVTTTAATGSTVRVIDRSTGEYEGIVQQNLPYRIVGAGVSTCAPVDVP